MSELSYVVMFGPNHLLGANISGDHVTFRVWAPDANSLVVRLRDAGAEVAMSKSQDGFFSARAAARAGASYAFLVDGRGPFPDPASRFQPAGVHGPSLIVDPSAFNWHDAHWTGLAPQDLVFYELHVGAFTPQGTFNSAAEKLPYLKDLGITAVELMPLFDFPGDRNWGYDGVAQFAPSRSYGTPDELRSFVDKAHRLGLAVFLDVVYNHLGPDGAYHTIFSAHYFTKRHHTPWGDAVNFDGPRSAAVRAYVVENALRWISEYHLDGLRLDATHAINDSGERHVLGEINAEVARASTKLGRRLHVVAEDSRNIASMIRPQSSGGLGFGAVWADDFHHQMRRTLAGDRQGYFAEVDGTLAGIAETIRRGWFRGHDDPAGLPYYQLVYCLQNHDQIGNRAFGDRLHRSIDPAAYRAASALLLLLPQTPLLFMGQEWAATSPFLYFTDHSPELGRAVTEGRRREFASFKSFSQEDIPDPQSPGTFASSKLHWDELTSPPHSYMLNLYKSLLALRRDQPDASLVSPDLRAEALDDATLLLRRARFWAVFRLLGSGGVAVPSTVPLASMPVWNSEDPRFCADPRPILADPARSQIHFARPGAIIFSTNDRSEP